MEHESQGPASAGEAFLKKQTLSAPERDALFEETANIIASFDAKAAEDYRHNHQYLDSSYGPKGEAINPLADSKYDQLAPSMHRHEQQHTIGELPGDVVDLNQYRQARQESLVPSYRQGPEVTPRKTRRGVRLALARIAGMGFRRAA